MTLANPLARKLNAVVERKVSESVIAKLTLGPRAAGNSAALPDPFEIHEYRMMERFAADTGDALAGAELLRALRGSGAFRRFKDTVLRLGLAEEWYAYRDRQYDEVARGWCEANDVELDSPLG